MPCFPVPRSLVVGAPVQTFLQSAVIVQYLFPIYCTSHVPPSTTCTGTLSCQIQRRTSGFDSWQLLPIRLRPTTRNIRCAPMASETTPQTQRVSHWSLGFIRASKRTNVNLPHQSSPSPYFTFSTPYYLRQKIILILSSCRLRVSFYQASLNSKASSIVPYIGPAIPKAHL